MKKLIKYGFVVVTILLCSFQQSFAQDNSTLSLLRPKQSLMSGGAGFNIQVYLNDVRIDDLANGVIINYSLLSEGEVTMKFQKEAMGSNHGAPKIIKLTVKKGSTYIYSVEAGMNDLTVEELDTKKADKLTGKSKNFEVTLDLKESAEKPIIK